MLPTPKVPSLACSLLKMTALKIAFLWREEGGDPEWGSSVSCPTPGTLLESQECPTPTAAPLCWQQRLSGLILSGTGQGHSPLHRCLGGFFSILVEGTGGRKTGVLNICSHSGASFALKQFRKSTEKAIEQNSKSPGFGASGPALEVQHRHWTPGNLFCHSRPP